MSLCFGHFDDILQQSAQRVLSRDQCPYGRKDDKPTLVEGIVPLSEDLGYLTPRFYIVEVHLTPVG